MPCSYGGQDLIALCGLEPFWDVPSSYCFFVFFFLFSFIVLCCETVSPPGRSTHSVREKRLTFNSKTSSGNINHVINKKCTSFNLFIYTFYTTVVITLGVFLCCFFFKTFQSDIILEAFERVTWKCTEHVYDGVWVSMRKKKCVFFWVCVHLSVLRTRVRQNILRWSLPKAQDFTKCSCQLGPPFLDESNKIDKFFKKKKKEKRKKRRIITAHLEFCFFSVKFWSKGFRFLFLKIVSK